MDDGLQIFDDHHHLGDPPQREILPEPLVDDAENAENVDIQHGMEGLVPEVTEDSSISSESENHDTLSNNSGDEDEDSESEQGDDWSENDEESESDQSSENKSNQSGESFDQDGIANAFLESDNVTDTDEGDNEDISRIEDGEKSEENLGRGMCQRHANPKYFNENFSNLQFLQHTFESLDQELRSQYLDHALDNFRLSGKTNLVERYLAGVALTQMSTSASLRKHGKEGDKCLLKEFAEFKNMDVMEAVDPGSLTPEQKHGALGMVSVIQEKRDHTPEQPHLKYQACANEKKQRHLYSKEETTSPTLSPDGFLLTLMTDAMEERMFQLLTWLEHILMHGWMSLLS